MVGCSSLRVGRRTPACPALYVATLSRTRHLPCNLGLKRARLRMRDCIQWNLGDESGKPLDGANKYTIHFDKGTAPPANAFWSITLYDQEGFQVANNLNRFAVSSWMPFQYNPDGSLDLYFQNESPGAEKEASWLPAPKGPST